MKVKRKVAASLMAAVMLIGEPAVCVQAADVQIKLPDFIVASAESGDATSVIGFAGQEWYVIGHGTEGVYPQSDSVTLLAKSLKDSYKGVPFRAGQSADPGDGSMKKYGGGYYANNPDGSEWKTPNEYWGSTLQQKTNGAAEGFSEKERALIHERTLAGGTDWVKETKGSADQIVGPAVKKQELWALSEDEWKKINNSSVLSYEDWWWMRSPYALLGSHAGESSRENAYTNYDYTDNKEGSLRPAFSLDLSSVLFGIAGDAGSEAAEKEGVLHDVSGNKGPIKLTVKDDGQSLKIEATQEESIQTGSTLTFSYSGEATGENQFVSCILADNQEVKYYGKLVDLAKAADGTLSIPINGVADGIYSLEVFSEQVNGGLHTNFASEPVTMTVDVKSGSGTVSDYSGTVSGHEHIYDKETAEDKHKVSAASCTEAAVYYKSCTCGENGKETFTAGVPLGHEMGEWETISSPNCTQEGSEKRSCKRCLYTETRGVDTSGHIWEDKYTIDKEASCTVEGSESIHCKNCDIVKDSRVIPKTAHSYKNGKCTVCGIAEEGTKPEKPKPEESNRDPEGTKGDKEAAKTGDGSNAGMLILLLFGSVVSVGRVLYLRRRAK